MDVVEMAVRDEHQVAALDLLQSVRGDRVVHYPWIDVDDLSFGAAGLPGPVADPCEADLSVQRHALPPSRYPWRTGIRDFPTRPGRICQSPRASRCSGR